MNKHEEALVRRGHGTTRAAENGETARRRLTTKPTFLLLGIPYHRARIGARRVLRVILI